MLLAAGFLLASACSPQPSEGVSVFPIIGDDPADLVETMEWGDTPALPEFPGGESTVLEILEDSTPEVLRVAVEGGGCPPTAQVRVTGSPEAVSIEMVLGGAIAPPGTECTDILTTHELIIRFHEPIDLDGLELAARRTGPGA